MIQQKRVWSFVLAVLAASAPGLTLRAQELTVDDARRVAPYNEYWGLVDTTLPPTADMQDRLNGAIRRAQQEFGGRGPALARYFLRHIQASPDNTAFFFLFRAVGDVETARILAQGMIDPPAPEGAPLGRDPGEISIGIEGILKNDGIGADPATTAVLQEALARARQKPGSAWMAGLLVSLLGKCTTPEAATLLRTLASDADPSIRQAAVTALGNTASPAAGETLERTLVEDRDPEARARAAASLARQGPAGAAALEASMARESDPRVFDEIVRALTAIQALPQDPRACLAVAHRCWDAYTARPLFQCWRATASRDDLIAQATGAGWTVRALALHALADIPGREDRAMEPLVRMEAPPPPVASAQDRQPSAMRLNPPRALPVGPSFDPALRDRLLQSAVEVLSRETSGMPAPDTLSLATAQLTRGAFWEIADRNMAVALERADRIVPVSGRNSTTGRFGESSDLAARDPSSYARYRRPRQLLAAGVIGIVVAPLLAVGRARRPSLALLLALGVWAAWTMFQSGVRELPPFPLVFLTVSFLAFMTAGVVSGSLTLLRAHRWVKALAAPVLAAICALVVCAFTRWTGIFPGGAEGWEMVFEPLASAMLAAPVALALSVGLEFTRR